MTSWANGVISPRVIGRTDLDKYYSSAEVIRDLIVLPQGGLKRRPGTAYIADAMGPSRLIPFIFSPSVAYIIELGAMAARFYYAYNDAAQSPNNSQPPFTYGAQIQTGNVPAWNQTLGGTTSDGSLTWTNRGQRSYATLTSGGAATALSLHTCCIDSNGNIQEVTTAGTTASQASSYGNRPLWNTAFGGTTTDGSVTWTNRGVPSWSSTTTFATNALVYTAYGIQQVTAGGGGNSGSGSAPIPFQIPTPFDPYQMSLWDVQYAQQGDIMYLVHPLYPVTKIERFGTSGSVPSSADRNWRLVQPNFYCPPTDPSDQDVSGGTITVTPSAQTGTGVTFTASSACFLPGDVGRFIVSDTQIALITAYISTTVVTCNILTSFTSTSAIAAGSWFLRGPYYTFAGVGSVSGGNFFSDNGFGVGQTVSILSYAKYPDNGSTAPATTDCFRSSDVGRYVNVSGCIAVITAFNNAHNVTAQYLSVPEQTFTGSAGGLRVSPSVPGAWTMEDPIWTGSHGYPGAVAFFQDRLFLAATPYAPKTVWASRTGDYENFAKGTNASDALDFTISGGKLDTIQWLAGTPVQGRLAIETDAAEYIAYAGGQNGDTITPTSINVQPNSTQGGTTLPPILVDAVLIYVQRYRTKVYEFAYNIYQSSFASKDLGLYAEHLTHAGIKEMAFQPNPHKIIWMVTEDGRMLGMTYDRTQDVCAWHEHRTGYADNGYGAVGTGDSFLSVAAIPNPAPLLLSSAKDGSLAYVGNGDPSYSSDLVWTTVKRKRNGSTVYTVELMADGWMADCCSQFNSSSFSSSALTTTITGAQLGGRLVVATGQPGNSSKSYFPYDAPLGSGTANSSGQITISTDVALTSLTCYGLPFQPTLTTRRVEIKGAPTVQGLVKRWSDLWIRVYETLGLTVNGSAVPFFNLVGTLPGSPAASLEQGGTTSIGVSDTMSDELAPLSTDVRVLQFGYDRLGRVTITQPQPLPVTLLAMFGTLFIGDQ